MLVLELVIISFLELDGEIAFYNKKPTVFIDTERAKSHILRYWTRFHGYSAVS